MVQGEILKQPGRRDLSLPNASLSHPELFFSDHRIKDYLKSSHEYYKQGSISMGLWATRFEGRVRINNTSHFVPQGRPYYELHFLPEGSLNIKSLFKKDVRQAESKSKSEEVLYEGARDLYKLLTTRRYSLVGGYFTVGYTNARLARLLIDRLGFNSFGELFPEDKGDVGLIILTRDLIAQGDKIRKVRDRLESTAGRRITERKKIDAHLIHEVTNRLPLT